MHELVVISGKGGTGKTSITGALIHLAENGLFCDLDVDAPDLHLLLSPEPLRRHEFISGNTAAIDRNRCTGCGVCHSICRFEAVVPDESGGYGIDPLRCEGCKVCVSLCPEKAVEFLPRHCGNWFVSSTRFGCMVHAQLFPGEENSGRLVALLRQQAAAIARERESGIIISDGSPGIGCPVISSLTGASMAVIVTEPTVSGLHDLRRVGGLCDHFRIKACVIINKYDLNPEESAKIEALCLENGYEPVGRLPFDDVVIESMIRGRVVTEMPASDFSRALERNWSKISEMLDRIKPENKLKKIG